MPGRESAFDSRIRELPESLDLPPRQGVRRWQTAELPVNLSISCGTLVVRPFLRLDVLLPKKVCRCKLTVIL